MTTMPTPSGEEALKLSIQVDPSAASDHLKEFVRTSVEEALNAALDAQADALCGAKRYERSADRVDGRAGHYERDLVTKAGTVTLKMPKLRKATFETDIIERYRRREVSVEEALVEMYLAGVSVRRVEDITEALFGSRVSASTVSELNQKIYETIDLWRNAPIEGSHPYVYLDGIYLKRSWGGEVVNVAVLVAIGVNSEGHREILGVAEGAKEDKESWLSFLRWLKGRGLSGTQMFITDCCMGLVEALGEVYPSARWQRCVVHFYRNVLRVVPQGRSKEVALMLKAIHAQEDRVAAQGKAEAVIAKLRTMKLNQAAEIVAAGIADTLSYLHFPREHWRSLKTNNPLERLNREIRRRTRVVGAFPDGRSALMLVAARLRYLSTQNWGTRRYLNMSLLIADPNTTTAA
jgi:putative transposase